MELVGLLEVNGAGEYTNWMKTNRGSYAADYGAISGRRISNSQIEYYIPVRGDYYLYIESTVKYSAVEFCAY